MNKVKYLVTGAAGFLGSTIVRQLTASGKQVRAFDLPGSKGLAYLPKEAEICEGNLLDVDSLERFFTVEEGTYTVVLHVASIVTVNPDYNRNVMNVNVCGTQNMIDMCLSHKECLKMVYCSSTGAIPEKKGVIRETDDFRNLDPKKVVGCYSQSKALATQAVLDAVNYRGLNACVVHPSGILGPEDNAVGETTGTLIKIINGEMPMGIDGSFNLCDVRDLAAGMIAAVEKGRRGECYILGNEEVSFRDFSRMVSHEAGCQDVKLFLPLKLADVMAMIMERQAARKGEKPVMTRFSIYNLSRNNKFDSTKAKLELGYKTRTYEETIRDEIAWLKETGKIA